MNGGIRRRMTERKSVYIRLDANHAKGMGHLYRMLVLANVLISYRLLITFIVKCNVITENILKSNKFKYLSFPESMSEENIIALTLSNHKSLPDLWVFDVLSTETVWIKLIKEKNIKVVCFDDEKGGLQEADLVINSIVHSWGRYDKESINVPLLEGTAYAILQPSVFNLRKERVIGDEEFLKVGITMGGSDTHGSTLVILKSVLDILDNYKFHVFTGPHFLHQDYLDAIMDSIHLDISVKHAVPDLHLELDTMDVVICGGGVTLFEICAMGLPVLAFANEVHEEKTIKYFSQHGACINIGSVQRGLDIHRMKQSLAKFQSGPPNGQMKSINGQKLVDGKGTIRCFNECVKLMRQ